MEETSKGIEAAVAAKIFKDFGYDVKMAER
jgi:hypothetical protein